VRGKNGKQATDAPNLSLRRWIVIRQRLSEKEFRELLVAENVINHSRNAPDTLRRRAGGILREGEELFQRFAVTARCALSNRDVIEPPPARVYKYL
jgi:hypothetical protein